MSAVLYESVPGSKLDSLGVLPDRSGTILFLNPYGGSMNGIMLTYSNVLRALRNYV